MIAGGQSLLLADPLIAEHFGLLTQATATVADPAIRHRATLGEALAHADPAGDLPAVALALDATLIARGPDGEREIPATDFFADYLTTSLQPGEILTAIRIPKLGPGWGYWYEKFRRTAQSWATVGVAALARRANGSVAKVRIGLTNMGSIPVRAARPRTRPPGCRPSGTRCGPPPTAQVTARNRRATCTARLTTAGTWPGCSPAGH